MLLSPIHSRLDKRKRDKIIMKPHLVASPKSNTRSTKPKPTLSPKNELNAKEFCLSGGADISPPPAVLHVKS